MLARGASTSYHLRRALCPRGIEGRNSPIRSLLLPSSPSLLLPSTRLVSTSAAAASSSTSNSNNNAQRQAFLPVPVKIVHVSSRDPLHDAVVDEWLEKARRHVKVQELRLPVNPKNLRGDVEGMKKAEGERVLKALSPLDFVVLLDERGKTLSSEKLAGLVAEAGERLGGGGGGGGGSGGGGGGELAFVLGGPFGHSPNVVERSDAKIALSPLVLNHAVARVVLAEALFRSYEILRGSKYHH